MIPDNYQNLIKKLIAKTKEGKTIWTKTSGEDEYKLELERGAITTDIYGGTPKTIDFRIWNDRGEVVDSLNYSAVNTQDYIAILELHTSAKRSFYNVDKILNDIFNELDSDKIIGKEDVDDDDTF